MSQEAHALNNFLAYLDLLLVQARPTSEEAAGLMDFARMIRTVDASTPPPPESPRRLPVCRFWEAALDAASRGTQDLAATLRTLGPVLSWTQNPNYRRQAPDPAFLDNYGYAVLAGPSDGPPALAVDPRLALGVLLLGPGTHYPLHHHPAVEVYLVVSGDAEWWRDAGPWRRQEPGALIYHAPDVPHAMRAGAHPLLAVYLWRGDLATHARLGGGVTVG